MTPGTLRYTAFLLTAAIAAAGVPGVVPRHAPGGGRVCDSGLWCARRCAG